MRYHFANSDSPLKEGNTVAVVCGRDIPHAAFIASADLCEISVQPYHLGKTCRKCWDAEWPKRFLYVVCSGQEAMTAE